MLLHDAMSTLHAEPRNLLPNNHVIEVYRSHPDRHRNALDYPIKSDPRIQLHFTDEAVMTNWKLIFLPLLTLFQSLVFTKVRAATHSQNIQAVSLCVVEASLNPSQVGSGRGADIFAGDVSGRFER